MPRKRKDQPPVVVPDQVYGTGADQLAQQREIPLPGPGAGVEAAPRSTAAAQAAALTPTPTVQGDPAAALEMARAMPLNPLGLNGPSTKPGEPVTAGVRIGPGVGPEGIPMPTGARNNEAALLDAMYETSGNPALAEMAARLRSGR